MINDHDDDVDDHLKLMIKISAQSSLVSLMSTIATQKDSVGTFSAQTNPSMMTLSEFIGHVSSIFLLFM